MAGRVVANLIRSVSPTITEDREYYRDIEKIISLVKSGEIIETIELVVGELK